MIDAVVPCLAGLLVVAVVALEQTDRFLVAYADNNFSLFTVLTTGAVGTQQIDVVLGIRNTHRAGFGCHPREGTQRHGGLGLSEALHHTNAGFLIELVIDCGIQSLAGSAAILKTAKVVLAQVLTNHETVDGGRCAETGHLIFLHLSQKRVGIELLVVKDKDRSASKPLSVELTPDGLTPASVGYGQV